MFFMMGAMGLAAYDELNHWGLFRLTLPLSRRDVVLGRYGAIVTLGLHRAWSWAWLGRAPLPSVVAASDAGAWGRGRRGVRL